MQACILVGLNRSMYYYNPHESERTKSDCMLLQQVYKEHKTMGSKLMSKYIKKNFELTINHKRIDRLRKEHVIMPPKKRKLRPKRELRDYIDLPEIKAANELWAIDFMHGRGRTKFKYKLLNAVDVFTKKAVVMDVKREMKSEGVIKALRMAVKKTSYPKAIISDNGSEFCSTAFEKWANRHGIELFLIEPGRPVQNCYIESFNSIVRRELLNENEFVDMEDCRKKVRKWKNFYNFNRPHGSISYQTPNEYSKKVLSE